jgi:hypothetical protein
MECVRDGWRHNEWKRSGDPRQGSQGGRWQGTVILVRCSYVDYSTKIYNMQEASSSIDSVSSAGSRGSQPAPHQNLNPDFGSFGLSDSCTKLLELFFKLSGVHVVLVAVQIMAHDGKMCS